MSHLVRIWQVRVISLVLICCSSVLAQWDKKPYTEWSDNDAQKVLNDSPWVKRQVISNRRKSKDTIKFNNGANGVDPSMPTPERISDSTYTAFYIRLLSAKPIREALKRNKLIEQEDERLTEKIKALVNSGPGEYIVIGIGHETKSEGARRYESHLLPHRISPEAAKETFLEVKGGQRLPLYAYYGGGTHDIRLGALFIFKRFVDGKPFVNIDSGELRFHTRFPSAYRQNMSDMETFIKLEVSYKVKNMLYEGNLEF